MKRNSKLLFGAVLVPAYWAGAIVIPKYFAIFLAIVATVNLFVEYKAYRAENRQREELNAYILYKVKDYL
jgi:hypothetical protein